MAQAYVKGPLFIYVGVGPSLTPTFLGTGERAPRVSLRRSWEKVFNDLSGTQIPYDYSFQGVEAFVTFKLTRWNQAVWNVLEDVTGAAVFSPQNTAVAGVLGPDDIGTLMVTEGMAVPLWVIHGFGSAGPTASPVPAMQNTVNGVVRPGYHFFAAFLDGPDDHEGGTDPASILGTFHCVRVFNTNNFGWNLWDQNFTGIPGIN